MCGLQMLVYAFPSSLLEIILETSIYAMVWVEWCGGALPSFVSTSIVKISGYLPWYRKFW